MDDADAETDVGSFVITTSSLPDSLFLSLYVPSDLSSLVDPYYPLHLQCRLMRLKVGSLTTVMMSDE